jgi:hypothetical protein
MSYETRSGKQYYYHVRRVNGRLVKSYLGNGPEAERVAAEVARRRQERLDQMRCNTSFETVLLSIRHDFEEFWGASELILQMAFRASNYNYDGNEWRRRREPRT